MFDTRMPAATSATVSKAPVTNGCASAMPFLLSHQSHEAHGSLQPTGVLLGLLTKHQATRQVKHLVTARSERMFECGVPAQRPVNERRYQSAMRSPQKA